MESREYNFIHPIRVSKIKKLSDIKEWKPNRGHTMYILEIDFENNDYIKFFGTSFVECEQFTVGQKYVYQLDTTTVVMEGQEPKTKNKFVFVKHLIPEEVESRMHWVTQKHQYIKISADLAVNTFSEISSFNDGEFKDRAAVIFDYMCEQLENLSFAKEKAGEEFDQLLKENQ